MDADSQFLHHTLDRNSLTRKAIWFARHHFDGLARKSLKVARSGFQDSLDPGLFGERCMQWNPL